MRGISWLALFVVGLIGPTLVVAQERCTLAITSPTQGGNVGPDGDATGTARGVPSGAHVWVLSHRRGIGLWWPQGGGEARLARAGEWKVFVTYGQDRDRGREFEVIVVAVSQQEHNDLNKWVAEAERSGKYNGIQMPTLIEACSPQTVVATRN
jgi:hypothetical protein